MNQRVPRLREFAEDAAVGIGTMIVFIATVLVAAIAAGVLIEMSGKLESRSSRTGEQSTQQVASNLAYESIIGVRNNTTSETITWLDVYIKLAPGAIDVDLSQMRLQIQTPGSFQLLNYSQSADPPAKQFKASAERDDDNSFSVTTPTMTPGDLVVLNLSADANSLNLLPRTELLMKLIPEVGVSVETILTCPNSYGSKIYLDLG